MNSFFLFLIFYFLTLSGHLLGKATKEEHKEVKKYALIFGYILQVLTLFFLLYLSSQNFIFILIVIICFGLLLLRIKNEKYFHDMSLLFTFSSAFYILNAFNILEVIVPILYTLLIEKSFAEFRLKEEVYRFFILIFLGVVFSFL